MSPITFLRAATLLATLPLACSAQAQQAYDLRALNVAVGFACCNPGAATTSLSDLFNNGNPLAGPAFVSSTGVSGNAAYTAQNTGFPAGSELSGPDSDYYGINFGAGRLRFAIGDATPNPSNLDLPGTSSVANRILLDNPGATPLLNRNQSFEVATFWNFTTPDAGTSYGIRLSDNPVTQVSPGSPSFNDLIDMRVVRSGAGQPLVQLRKISWDGSLLTVTQNFTQAVATGLIPGHVLSEVAAIELNLHYNTGIGALPYLLPAFVLMDGNGIDIGRYEFTQVVTLFNGEDFTRVVAGANFTVAVPEPGSAALLLGGGFALAVWRRRRV